ncbi:YobA family protein [Brevibacillus humidisoli]|uniref:YobA family protein n=1 Tax=Brevibacillus humidisoli TaxID=2895522 RepID=UPI001E5FB024|nr:YobA family protein [Brevibacillus humidisoli]UFJ41211.1 YobA family protein [Brevibacillus humidisoli]
MKQWKTALLLSSALISVSVGAAFAQSEVAERTVLQPPAQQIVDSQEPAVGTDDEQAEKVDVQIDAVTNGVNKITLTSEPKANAGYQMIIREIIFNDDGTANVYYELIAPQPDTLHAQVITEAKAVTYLPADYKPVVESISNKKVGNDDTWTTEDEAASNIDGNVTEVKLIQPQEGATSEAKRLATILVEKPERTDSYDKIVLTITEETKLVKQQGDVYVPAALEDIKKGVSVKAVVTGPFALSYPAQAAADKILIVE